MSDLRKIPKVEFHRHLDGSIRFETIVDLWKKNKLDLGIRNEDELYKKVKVLSPMKDLESVLSTFWTMQKVMCHYDAIKRITFENVEDCVRDGIVLSELRFSPLFIAQGKSLSNDEIIEGVLDGMTLAMEKYPIQVGLIGIASRSLDFKKSQKSLEDIIKYKKSHHAGSDRLVGFDLADDEVNTDSKKWATLCQMAIKNNLAVTVHSGEGTTPEYILRTIEECGAKRIGHGTALIQSLEAMEIVREKNIHIEINLTSNYLTNAIDHVKNHPVKKYLEFGLNVCLNSDDPHLMNIDLTHEYELAERYFNFSSNDFVQMNLKSLPHSFLDLDVINHCLKSFQ